MDVIGTIGVALQAAALLFNRRSEGKVPNSQERQSTLVAMTPIIEGLGFCNDAGTGLSMFVSESLTRFEDNLSFLVTSEETLTRWRTVFESYSRYLRDPVVSLIEVHKKETTEIISLEAESVPFGDWRVVNRFTVIYPEFLDRLSDFFETVDLLTGEIESNRLDNIHPGVLRLRFQAELLGDQADRLVGYGIHILQAIHTQLSDEGIPTESLRIMRDVGYYSNFIAYGEPDKDIAERLYQDLKVRGLSCWMYSMDSTPGERTQREIGQKRREAEKFVVLCSAGGLIRDGVLKEIEEQMDEDPDKIIPVSLEDLWKHPGFRVIRGVRDLKPFLVERNYVQLGEGADYTEALHRLLQALEWPKA